MEGSAKQELTSLKHRVVDLVQVVNWYVIYTPRVGVSIIYVHLPSRGHPAQV